MKIQETSNGKIRFSMNENYFFVRNLEEKGGVIDAIVKPVAAKKVYAVLSAVKNETFSQVWDCMNKIKGCNVDFRSN